MERMHIFVFKVFRVFIVISLRLFGFYLSKRREFERGVKLTRFLNAQSRCFW